MVIIFQSIISMTPPLRNSKKQDQAQKQLKIGVGQVNFDSISWHFPKFWFGIHGSKCFPDMLFHRNMGIQSCQMVKLLFQNGLV